MSGVRHTVWREDNRIRATDGGGFADFITDAQLGQYADDANSTEVTRAFAKATLAIREFERAAAAEAAS